MTYTIFTLCIRIDRPEKMKNAASHQGLHCLPLIQQFLDTTSGSKLYLFKFMNKYCMELRCLLIVLGFNNTSTLVGHFVSSPRESVDRRDSRGDKREGQEKKRNRNESGETEEIETFPLYPYLLQG